MKYLKRFNESNTDDVIENVKDILLPISDMGYEISVTEYRSELLWKKRQAFHCSVAIRVVTWTDKPLWITDEVKEEFIRMKDYLQSEGYDSIEALYHLATPGDISSRKIEEFDRFMRYEQWQKVKIGNLIFVAKK